jgi:hypothetical protein
MFTAQEREELCRAAASYVQRYESMRAAGKRQASAITRIGMPRSSSVPSSTPSNSAAWLMTLGTIFQQMNESIHPDASRILIGRLKERRVVYSYLTDLPLSKARAVFEAALCRLLLEIESRGIPERPAA